MRTKRDKTCDLLSATKTRRIEDLCSYAAGKVGIYVVGDCNCGSRTDGYDQVERVWDEG
jgi:hypothetical protein